MNRLFDPKNYEAKWQKRWELEKAFEVSNTDANKPKFYALDMFPYPSGAGLHVGHPRGYTATDIISRYRRMKGDEVLHPMGWDAFGLPAENYAIKTKIHPDASTRANIVNFTKQIKSLGFSYDWSREIATCDPEYYRWTQWWFLFLYHQGLAYRKNAPVNWCPSCQTVLANEQVVNGKCERCGTEVIQKQMAQWFFKITDCIEDQEMARKPGKVVILHGWEGTPEGNFIPWLRAELEKQGWKVEAPQLPNAANPKANEWFSALDKLNLDEETTIVGHSLGGTIITRWLESRRKKLGKVILVAAPYTNVGIEQVQDVCSQPVSSAIASLAEFTMLNSDNDQYVSLDEAKKYADLLGIPVQKITGVGHFQGKEYPVLFDAVTKTVTHGLISGLQKIDWPQSTKTAQENWIGKSEGAEVRFEIEGKNEQIAVFTTRPDTLFGVTFLVLAPEHPLVASITTESQQKEVNDYISATKKKTDLDRQSEKEKTGVFTGSYAVNPLNGEKTPIWIADYVLMGYGTGAIMAVPAHDERDFAFAKKYDLSVKPVVLSNPGKSYSYLMGGANITKNDLESLKIEVIKTDENGNHSLKIPFESIDAYANLIREKLEIGFWNEYSTPTTFHFIFKHKNGRIEEYDLSAETNDKIDQLSAEFNQVEWGQPGNVFAWKSWISGNHLYSPLLLNPEYGISINSKEFSGLPTAEVKEKIIAKLESLGYGEQKTTYKLRDWLVSRQRYWGAPIPIIYCNECGEVPVPESDLPVVLPTDVDFVPHGESPLTQSKSFHDVSCPKCGKKARRESDTMDTFVCSSWYFFRFADPKNSTLFANREAMKKWLPVDLYVGGAEHTVLHLLYSRFFTKVAHRNGLIDFDEPFTKLRHQGLIMAEDGRKMSKSLGNVVNPDDVVAKYGADTLRMYEMFIGPFADSTPWSMSGVEGVYRFLKRVFALYEKEIVNTEPTKEQLRTLHACMKQITNDIEDFGFNTAISALMIFVNDATKWEKLPRSVAESFAKILSPFAPHLAEELWEQLGHTETIVFAPWPVYNEAFLVTDTVTMGVSINGKVRDEITVSATASNEEVLTAAKASEKVQKWLAEGKLVKEIVVPKKLVNFVVTLS